MSLRKKLKKHKQMHKERGRNMSDYNNGKQLGEVGGHGVERKEIDEENIKLPDDENLHKKEEENLKGNEDLSNLTKQQDENKPDFPAIEVIKIEDESEEEIPLNWDENLDLTNQNILHQNSYYENPDLNNVAALLIGSQNRGLFPDPKIKNCKLSEVPNLKRCLIEHSYFLIDKPGFIPLTDQGNIKVNTLRKPESRATVPFQNRIEFNENRTEQQTLAESDSITKHVFRNSHFNLSNNNIVRASQKKRAVSRINRTISNSESGNSDGNQKPGPLRYSLRSFVRRSSSNGSNENVVNSSDSNSSMTRGAEESVNPTEGNKLISDSAKSNSKPEDKRLVSLDDIAKEISEMEKIIQSKCDLSCDKKAEKSVENGETTCEVQPPKLRKIRSKDDLPKSQKDGDYVVPMPNLTKMAPGDKNWNLEYTEDDVKSLGLDDLLLKASELNAENFTKALGQNAIGRNGSKSDGSEILLSFPNQRRGGEEIGSKESDSSKAVIPKRTKLDFYKTYVKDDKSVKAVEEEVKVAPVASPKRLGIKVKTVQNINEEFKDSLGAKLKNLETSDTGMSKPLYKISDDGRKEGQSKEIFVPEPREEMVSSTRPAILGRKIQKPSEPSKNNVEAGEETRPFIMTIIQNKENSANDRLPRVLSPKIFTRPKSVSENGFEERRIETRKDGGNENVTLFVSEPRNARPFEVVNVEDYIPDPNCYQPKKSSALNYVVHYRNGTLARKRDIEGKILQTVETGSSGKKKNIPVILNHKKKFFRMANGEKTLMTTIEDPGKRIVCSPRPGNRLIKHALDGGVQGEKSEKGSFTVKSIEQKIVPKESGVRLVKAATNCEQSNKAAEESKPEEQQSMGTENGDKQLQQKHQLMSLAAFSNILKDILPDKWILSLDKRYGLQILKTHLDELLNPSIMISVVVGRTGKVTVNVRGRQLEKSHDLFSNLCDVGNSKEKISINYILSIINKLRFFNVCFGCDDLSLKKYWCEDGFIEYYTEFQQTYRSHICESLVRLGKRRCYPCHRMHESLKKRKRREQLGKRESDPSTKNSDSASKSFEENGNQSKSVKRNFEEFIEESFINMKQKITDEIEKTREDEESEKVPKTQDEVLSFMGLTRKDSLDVNLRKSKRERKAFKKCEPMIGNHVNKEELYFLEKYWTDINVLFSTSLLIGAYSRTSTPRLREKCRMFHKLLSTWRGIVRDNPDWIGGHINLAENLVEDDESGMNGDSAREKFEKMDIPALRAYIINCVKEVNKIKSRLRTKNAYFKVLYNTFVKPRMKKVRQSSELHETTTTGTGTGTTTTTGATAATEKEQSKMDEEDSPEKSGEKVINSANTTSTEMDSSDEKEEESRHSAGIVSDGD